MCLQLDKGSVANLAGIPHEPFPQGDPLPSKEDTLLNLLFLLPPIIRLLGFCTHIFLLALFSHFVGFTFVRWISHYNIFSEINFISPHIMTFTLCLLHVVY